MIKKRGRADKARKSPAEGCTVPKRLPTTALPGMVTPQPKHEAEDIRRYVEIEAHDETVIHLEKVKSEVVQSKRMDVWDVHTDKSRWWVITNLTNLYPQDHFPSLDYTLTFHVGLMARLAERDGGEPDPQKERIAAAWRRLDQAEEALELADEAEEFQAVGMRCREALLAFVSAVRDPSMVRPGAEAPKASDFVRWSEIVADTIAGGESASAVRGFLKSTAKSTWQLVAWLTHAQNAVRHDADLAAGATGTVLGAFTGALMRYESGQPDRCPRCGSYRLRSWYKPELRIDPPYITVCGNCEGTEPQVEAANE
jgi:hypothetical protein